jgi:hypothetical protein
VGMHKDFFSSTMRPATRNMQTMHFQLYRWSKVRPFLFLKIFIFISPSGPNKGWTHKNCGTRMRCGTLPNGESQSFYFPDDGPERHPTMPGWFKGMEQILWERGLWPEGGLRTQCPKFKCTPGRVDCCCRRILYLQPDFIAQKSQLEELIERCNHLCDFYPKYHCKLNFIEQFWGAAKAKYRVAPRAKTTQEMETAVRDSLDGVPILQIRRSVLFFFCPSLLIPSQVCKSSSAVYHCLQGGVVGCTSSVGKQKVPRTLYFTSRENP